MGPTGNKTKFHFSVLLNFRQASSLTEVRWLRMVVHGNNNLIYSINIEGRVFVRGTLTFIEQNSPKREELCDFINSRQKIQLLKRKEPY